jgi:carbonic anhydrase
MKLALAAILFSLTLFGSAQELPVLTPAPAAHQATKPAPSSPEKIWADLMAGNARFVSGKSKLHNVVKLRKALVRGQHPEAVVLSCSDSRVPPEILFDKTLGEIFVVRSAGNIADAIGVGSIEYAVEHLGTSMLVILGHEHCGAVTAACSPERPASPNLQVVVDKIAPAVTQARNSSGKDDVIDSAILENIHQSARDVLAQSEVLRHAFKDGKLTVIEAIYSLESGEVRRLGQLSLIMPAYRLDVGDVVRLQ